MSYDNILLADFDMYTVEIGQTRKFNASRPCKHILRAFFVSCFIGFVFFLSLPPVAHFVTESCAFVALSKLHNNISHLRV